MIVLEMGNSDAKSLETPVSGGGLGRYFSGTNFRFSLIRSIVLVILVAATFKVVQRLLQPGQESLAGSVTDVVFALVAATTGIFFALRKQEILVRQLSSAVAGRKRAKDTLAIVSKAVEQSTVLVMIADREGRIIYVNPEFEKQTGYSKNEAIDQTTRLLKSGRHSQDLYAALWQTILSGNVYNAVLTNKKKGGELFYAEETITPVRDSDGRVTHFVSTSTDITERIRTQETLSRRQSALQSVYQIATTTGVSFDGVCDQVALTVARLLEVPHVLIQQLVGGHARVISAVADGSIIDKEAGFRERPFTDIHSGQTDVVQIAGTLREQYPDNDYFPAHDIRSYFSLPIKNNAGKTVGGIVAMDRKERTLSKEDLQLVEIFASYVAHEIERACMEAQIDHAREMRVFGQVASGIAHEVRNPLSAILSITEVVCQDLRGRRKYEIHLAHIRDQVARLSVLMQELLDLGKPLNVERLQRMPLMPACQDAIALWKQYTKHRDRVVRLVEAPGRNHLGVLAESGKLHQVLVNLLENAAQHSHEGSEIRLVVERRENAARVQVTDQGTGISDKHMARIFEPFFTTRAGGTGLGLTVIKRIVELHGGSVTIRNNVPPPGCTVQVDLPAAPDQ